MLDTTSFSAVIGVDIAKNVSQVYTVIEDGEVSNHSVKRSDFLKLFTNRERCLIGMEACGGSQEWARQLIQLGHTVHLMAPKQARKYVEGQKSDRNNAQPPPIR